MKRVFTIFCCLGIAFSCSSQTTVTKVKKNSNTATIKSSKTPSEANAPAEGLTLKETEFDFGKIPQGKPVTHIFEFTNTSGKPFALENVLASCGCTTP